MHDVEINVAVTDAHLIRPGDYLVLMTEELVSQEQAANIKAAVKRECPLLAGVVVAGRG